MKDDDDFEIPLSERVKARMRQMTSSTAHSTTITSKEVRDDNDNDDALIIVESDQEEEQEKQKRKAIPPPQPEKKKQAQQGELKTSPVPKEQVNPPKKKKLILPDRRQIISLPNERPSTRTIDGRVWTEKHKPTTESELAVSPKKVSEVKNWLQSSLSSSSSSNNNNKVLSLIGPSGAGRTAMVRVLANSLGAKVEEFQNPAFPCILDIDGKRSVDLPSRIDEFHSWLHMTVLSQSVITSNTYSQKILLLEDLPFIVNSTSNSFRQALLEFSNTKTSFPLVIIMSESKNQQDYSQINLAQTIIQQTLLSLPCSKTIKIPPVAPKRMEKLIANVSKSEGIQLSKLALSAIVGASQGDIRCAINTLQFHCKSFMQSSISSSLTRDICSTFGTRDASLSLFHAIGKILYSKRIPETTKLESSPESIISNCLIASPRHLIGSSFENYTDFFKSVDDSALALENLSYADSLYDKPRQTQWQSDSILDDIQSLISVFGLMVSNKHTENISHGFHTMRKSLSNEVWHLSQTNIETFSEISCAMFPIGGTARILPLWILSRNDIQMQVVPYASFIPGSLDFCQSILSRLQFFSSIQSQQQNKQQQNENIDVE